MHPTESHDNIQTSVDPQAWRATRWVGAVAGHATGADLLAGSGLGRDQYRSVTRVYASACADLAQATLGGVPSRSATWEWWFTGLRRAAGELSPARYGHDIVPRALFHGARLEGSSASWTQQLRRGFSALLAASLPEPVPALVGEDIEGFRTADQEWLARQSITRPEHEPDARNPIAGDESGPRYASRWPTASLRPNPFNPRLMIDPASVDDLATSIATHRDQGGILQPLLVTPDGTVVAGHRRLAAARRAGLTDVPVIVRSLSPVEQLEIQLVENLQRADLTPIEEARAYHLLLEVGTTLASIARTVGVPANRVRDRLTLLDLDEQVQGQVHRNELPMRVALLLAPLRDQARQRRLAGIAARRRLTVAQVRRLVEAALAIPPDPVCAARLPPDDEPNGGGISLTRRSALDALLAQPDSHVSFGQLATLAESECCSCGLASAPAICAECPNLHLLQAVLREPSHHAA